MKNGLPSSIRLLNEAHRRLLKNVPGTDNAQGKIRHSQNWIGGTRPDNAVFVPPPPLLLGGLLGFLENYIHGKDSLHPLLYLNLYFKHDRAECYLRLNAVRTDGDFEGWLKYFLEGVAVIADETVATTRQLFTQTNADRTKVLSGRSTSCGRHSTI